MRSDESIFHFASALVAVDSISSHMTTSSSALWSSFSPPLNFVSGHVSTMRCMVCRWPQSQEGDWTRPYLCMTWALACPEMVEQRPCVTREIKTWLWIVGSVTLEWLTTEVLSPLCSCVDKWHVWPYWALGCKPWRWMLKDIKMHGPIWVGFADLIC